MKPIALPLSKLITAALVATSLFTAIFAHAAPQKEIATSAQSNPQEQNFSNIHVVVTSTKPFDKTVEDLRAELGKTSTEDLMRLLSASKTFDEYATEVEPLAGRSHLIEVGFLGHVLDKGISALDCSVKLIAIDEQPKYDIMHLSRLGKTNRLTS